MGGISACFGGRWSHLIGWLGAPFALFSFAYLQNFDIFSNHDDFLIAFSFCIMENNSDVNYRPECSRFNTTIGWDEEEEEAVMRRKGITAIRPSFI